MSLNSEYISVTLELDALDLIQIESLIEHRINELEEVKAQNDAWIHQRLADEQIDNYKATQRRIKAARKEVKRVKAEADAAFSAGLKARANSRRQKQEAVVKRMTPRKNA